MSSQQPGAPAVTQTSAIAIVTDTDPLAVQPVNVLETPSPIPFTPTPVIVTATPAATLSRLADLVQVRAGNYQVGSPAGSDPFSESIERPEHTVFIKEYWIEVYEVSNARYAACVAAGECTPPKSIASETRTDYYGTAAYSNFPVVNVTYDQAQTYCGWAGGRLPTEAEWEKAARQPDNRLYPWGNITPDTTLANFKKVLGDTSEVNAYPQGATSNGVYNMAGNVWEWVADWFDGSYYAYSSEANPTGPVNGTERVLRGGSWQTNAVQFLRAANRYHRPPVDYNTSIGFRCVTDEP
jgi:formylglycine-generating enzyme required for sulfatase activity